MSTIYPRCHKLGLLRFSKHGKSVTLSTSAMHEVTGWDSYKEFIEWMNDTKQPLCPETAEKWLQSEAEAGRTYRQHNEQSES